MVQFQPSKNIGICSEGNADYVRWPGRERPSNCRLNYTSTVVRHLILRRMNFKTSKNPKTNFVWFPARFFLRSAQVTAYRKQRPK